MSTMPTLAILVDRAVLMCAVRTAVSLLAIVALPCCQVEDEDDGSAVGSTTQVIDPIDMECPDRGGRCECGELGNYGTLECEGGEEVCDCSACPSFDPTPATFDPCGGDVWGTWRLIEATTQNTSLYFSSVFSETVTECEAMVVPGEVEREVALQLLEGGTAHVVANESVEETFRFTTECAPFACEIIELEHQSVLDASWAETTLCESAACGLCECTIDASHSTAETTTWTINVAGLLQIAGLGDARFEYCATDTQLVLSASTVLYTFERAEIMGVPLACEARTPETCEAGSGCERGACVGAASCEGLGQSSCVTYPECSWDADSCGGQAPDECELADVGTVPGCEF